MREREHEAPATPDRDSLLSVVQDAEPATLPRLAGLLAEAQALLLARLAQGQPQADPGGTTRPRKADEPLLSVDQALALVPMPRRTFLRLTRGLPFRRDLSRKTVVFERGGLMAWNQFRTA